MSNRTKNGFTLSLSKGFTLIELLVVIAIIGILAALVLVALGNARQKAADARIKSDLGQLRTMAEVFYDGNNATYTNFDTCEDGACLANGANFSGQADVGSLVADILEASGAAPNINAGAQVFCASSRLASDNAVFACVDASGDFAQGTAAQADCGAAATACP